jgi:opacity protein-like surface antigen
MLSAQDKVSEKRKFGLTFPNIGIIWHISDNVAFVPDINLTHGWSELGSSAGDSKTNSVGIDAALRFYVHDWKGIRLYLSPKYGYSWSNAENSAQGSNSTSDLHNHSVSGAWGLEYAVSDRISLFGDIGVRYMHGKTKTESSSQFNSDSKSNLIGTVGTWGLILHLK